MKHLKCIEFGCLESKYVTGITEIENNYTNENKNIENVDPEPYDEYEILHEMAFGVQFHGVIQNICIRKFHLTYFSPEQIELFRDFVNCTNLPVVLFV